MRIYDVIDKKKKGKTLSKKEIEFFIKGVCNKSIADYQTSAMLMAICINGMTDKETFYLTKAMLYSGNVEKKKGKGITVDKHSTGGVADSTTLVISPILALAGLKTKKLSGRGLGQTGGTLDKLEAFNGFNVSLTNEQFNYQVEKIGVAVAGQTEDTAYADKILYALRDVTATIDSLPLIASSIMSKKLAKMNDVLLLDVKYGNGAFMKNKKDATILAKLMCDIGKRFNRKTIAVISNMNQPLGDSVGCNFEVSEGMSILKGETKNDLYSLSKIIFEEIVKATNISIEKDFFDNRIKDGSAINKLKEMVLMQGGTGEEFEENYLFPKGKIKKEIKATDSGYIKNILAMSVGKANLSLGGGREKKTDKLDKSVGVILSKRVGDKVYNGDTILTLYANDEEKLRLAEKEILKGIKLSKDIINKEKLVYKIIR